MLRNPLSIRALPHQHLNMDVNTSNTVQVAAMMSVALGAVMQRNEIPRPAALVLYSLLRSQVMFNYCHAKYRT